MELKKKYIAPEFRIIPIEHRDIITGSNDPEPQDLEDPIIDDIPTWEGFFGAVILPLFLCLSLCFSSCQDNELPEPPVEDLVPLSFSVAIEGNEDNTRTAISSEKIVWEEGDKITLFDGAGNREFSYSSTSKKFVGEALAHKTAYLAIYPYTSAASSQTGSLYNTVTINAEQQAINGTFDKSSVPMIAYVDATNNNKLHFLWAFSLLKIVVPSGASYNKIVVSNYSSIDTDSYLSGTATVSYNAGVSISKSTGSSSVSLVPSGAGSTIGEGTYYLSIFPCSLTGLQVACYNEEKISFISLAKKQIVDRYKAIDLGVVEDSRITCDAINIGCIFTGQNVNYYIADRNLGNLDGTMYSQGAADPSKIWGPGWILPGDNILKYWTGAVNNKEGNSVSSSFDYINAKYYLAKDNKSESIRVSLPLLQPSDNYIGYYWGTEDHYLYINKPSVGSLSMIIDNCTSHSIERAYIRPVFTVPAQ